MRRSRRPPTPSSVRAHNGSARAIIGTGADAIIGTGADAIIGTGADAIIGTGAQKSASTDAIIGTGKKRQAIIGTGADAIIGTGADAIIGTGAQKSASTDAIIGTGKTAVLLVGPIDSVNVATGTISVLGKTLRMPSTERISAALAAGTQLVVAVSGKLSANGTTEQMKLRFVPVDYVAGATKVLASGRVSSFDSATGTMRIGSLTVDINSASFNKSPSLGSVVQVAGTQPLRKGTVLAETIFVR